MRIPRKAVAVALTLLVLQLGVASLTSPVFAETTESTPVPLTADQKVAWVQNVGVVVAVVTAAWDLVQAVTRALNKNHLVVVPAPLTGLD